MKRMKYAPNNAPEMRVDRLQMECERLRMVNKELVKALDALLDEVENLNDYTLTRDIDFYTQRMAREALALAGKE
jgi:hypothetical protein